MPGNLIGIETQTFGGIGGVYYIFVLVGELVDILGRYLRHIKNLSDTSSIISLYRNADLAGG